MKLYILEVRQGCMPDGSSEGGTTSFAVGPTIFIAFKCTGCVAIPCESFFGPTVLCTLRNCSMPGYCADQYGHYSPQVAD